MTGKIELIAVWLFSLFAYITQDNIAFIFSIVASVTVIAKNTPDIYRIIKKINKNA
jgi:hypothetical protein